MTDLQARLHEAIKAEFDRISSHHRPFRMTVVSLTLTNLLMGIWVGHHLLFWVLQPVLLIVLFSMAAYATAMERLCRVLERMAEIIDRVPDGDS